MPKNRDDDPIDRLTRLAEALVRTEEKKTGVTRLADRRKSGGKKR